MFVREHDGIAGVAPPEQVDFPDGKSARQAGDQTPPERRTERGQSGRQRRGRVRTEVAEREVGVRRRPRDRASLDGDGLAKREIVSTGAQGVVAGGEDERGDGEPPPPLRPRDAGCQQARQHRPQVDVDDGQPIDAIPDGAERAQHARAVGGGQVHGDVADNANHRGREEGLDRGGSIPAPANPLREPDDGGCGDREGERQRAVRRSAVRRQVGDATARECRQDLDVRDVRGDDQRGGRPAPGTAQPRIGQRHGEQRMGDVVHASEPQQP